MFIMIVAEPVLCQGRHLCLSNSEFKETIFRLNGNEVIFTHFSICPAPGMKNPVFSSMHKARKLLLSLDDNVHVNSKDPSWRGLGVLSEAKAKENLV